MKPFQLFLKLVSLPIALFHVVSLIVFLFDSDFFASFPFLEMSRVFITALVNGFNKKNKILNSEFIRESVITDGNFIFCLSNSFPSASFHALAFYVSVSHAK